MTCGFETSLKHDQEHNGGYLRVDIKICADQLGPTRAYRKHPLHLGTAGHICVSPQAHLDVSAILPSLPLTAQIGPVRTLTSCRPES